jgi:hypothetical protein
MIEPKFAFGKKIGISDSLYGDIPSLVDLIHRLLFCMKENNKIHGTTSEFFRLDFRHQYLDEQISREFPLGALVLDLKFGSQKEVEDLKTKKKD